MLKRLFSFEKFLFSTILKLFYYVNFRFTYEVVLVFMRKDPWFWIHFPMSFVYVTCVWFHMYIWYAKMSQAYFISCFYELPLIWDIFVCIILPDFFPNWFDFYEVPGIENLFIEDYPDKELKKR